MLPTAHYVRLLQEAEPSENAAFSTLVIDLIGNISWKAIITDSHGDGDVEGPYDPVAAHRAFRLRGGTYKVANDCWPERYSEGILLDLCQRARVRRLQGGRRSFHSPRDEIGQGLSAGVPSFKYSSDQAKAR